MRPRAVAAALAACSLALAACGDDGGSEDAGPRPDARVWADAAAVACGPALDAGCEATPLTPVCDPDRERCVECTGDADCAGRDDAFGPTCLEPRGVCQCTDDDACEGNPNGPRCHPQALACTCIDDGDCAAPATCELQPYLGSTVRTCTAP